MHLILKKEVPPMRSSLIPLSSSIDIIGGADGPTAIMVSSNWWALPLVLAAAAAVLLGIILLIRKRKKS